MNLTMSEIVELALDGLELEDIDAVEAADKYLYISEDGGVVKFRSELVPYMIKPILFSFSRLYRELIVCAAARSGKSKALIEAVMAFRAWQLPSNILCVYPTKVGANKYSKTEIDRMINATPFMKRLKTTKVQDVGILEKRFKNGSIVRVDSATDDALSQVGYGLVVFTDYDRSSDDGSGGGESEGSKFSRGSTRTKSDRSSGMCIAESSPSRMPIRNQKNLGVHELPRADGIAGLYNEGTRHWYYWQCPECECWMKCEFSLLKWTKGKPDSVYAQCPHCEAKFVNADQFELNLAGDYFQEGEIDKFGNRTGIEPPAPIKRGRASFHFSGVNAFLNRWSELVSEYETALDHWEKTGDDSKLQAHWNTNEGIPFVPLERESDLTVDKLMSREHSYLVAQGIAPSDTRFIVACVDVQGGKFARFEVNVFAINALMQWQPIDKFAITHNHENVVAGEPQPVRPEANHEDFRVLIDRVIQKQYRVDGYDDGRTLVPAFTLCDSGGSAEDLGASKGNTTFNAYQFYRELEELDIDHRFMLVKGNPQAFRGDKSDQMCRLTHPESDNKDHPFAADGDIPLLNLNSNRLKSLVYSSLLREENTQTRYFRRPAKWCGRDWYEGLLAESQNDQGKWVFEGSGNEPFDLSAYLFACLWENNVFQWRFDGDESVWAQPLERNVNFKMPHEHSFEIEEDDIEDDYEGYQPSAF
ncbi:terminase gpA endonuclease subunit [Vibrio aquimaris]|uniref:Phage terminase large subunit (GpA) n=1 Tax=Vibrio aquimaris TaxID=2587862 RepID=A0A5P9CRH7_9VIBR|nr:terminase gpA endonuclease subunit [Vibrio aquimaris]QFT28838.1 Phage terminase large subunit (GpA) [Vibrio aquimaris]